MDISDPMMFGQLAIRVGLIDQTQLNEAVEDAREEYGRATFDLIHLTRTLERKGYLTNLQTSKLIKGDTDGYFLGGYRILYKISSGSFGRVYRADDPRSGRVVAVKILRRRWSEDQAKIDAFIREGRVGLTLKHPNIVEIMAINQEAGTGQYYIVMEFVEGENLRELLQRLKTLTVDKALRILEDAVSGLAYAYSRGVTHRDIKLTNLLISSSGEAKLVDFGLAQMFASMSREDEVVDRTVDYAGLEKATGVKSGDVRSDLFFLGCVFFETLTSRSPITMTKDKYARMARRRFEEAEKLKPGEIDAPPSVYQLCETMMSIDPRRRYQTPSQVLDAVRAARRDLAGGGGGGAGAPGKSASKSIFLAESDQRLQEALRAKFKELGYRVFLAADPTRALDRFRQQPYEALIVDVGTVGDDGLYIFEQVLNEARDKQYSCSGILILSEEQAALADRVLPRPNSAVLVRPVTLKQLHRKLQELAAAPVE
jgi:eukaryotic-like serine/threonine-protein kinase